MTFKKTLIALFVLFLGFSLISCEFDENKNPVTNDIEVLSFSLDVEEYTYEESANIKIYLQNFKNYKIVSYQINDEIYSVDSEVDGGITTLRTTVDLKLGNNTFELKNIKYIKSESELTYSPSGFKSSTVRLSDLNSQAPISVTEMNLSDKNADYVFYNGDSISITIKFDNPKKYEIKTVILNEKSFVLENNAVDECTITTKIVDNSNVYLLNALTYIDDKNEVKTIQFEEPYKIQITVATTGIVPLEFKLDTNASEDIIGSTTKGYSTTLNSRVNFKVKVSNQDSLLLTRFVLNVNGADKEVNNWKLNKTTTMYQIYEFEIWFKDSTLNTQNIKLNKVIYKNIDNEEFSNSYGSSPTYKLNVYDKLIKTYDDFLSINDNLSGNYLLANDINANKVQSTLIGNFSGKLDGNGYSVSGNGYASIVPIFNQINTGATVTNINFKNWEFINTNKQTFSCLTNKNYGTVYNASFINSKVSSTISGAEVSTLATENHGKFNDLYVSFVNYAVDGSVYGISKINFGEIQRLYLNFGNVSCYENNEIYLTIKTAESGSVFANTIIENNAGQPIRDSETRGAKITVGASEIVEGATVVGVHFNADIKNTGSGYFTLNDAYQIILKDKYKNKWVENATAVSNSQLYTSSFFTSVLGFNNGTENTCWKIMEDTKPRLLIMY